MINQMDTGSMGMVVNKANSKVKIIKRYQNRKLYDTQQSCYVTLDDIAKMIRTNEEVMVIDNKSKNDITAATLTQIIFEAEKKASQYAPLFTLREIIQSGNGSISNFLAKLGAFPQDYMTKQAQQAPAIEGRASTDELKQNLEQRVASAAARIANDTAIKANAEKATAVLPMGASNEETLHLPTSNITLNAALPISSNFSTISSNTTTTAATPATPNVNATTSAPLPVNSNGTTSGSSAPNT